MNFLGTFNNKKSESSLASNIYAGFALQCFLAIAVWGQQIPFTMEVIKDNLAGPGKIQMGDINGDNAADVVVNAFRGGGKIVWYEGQNWTEETIVGSWSGGGFADLADLDGDSDLDVIASSWQWDDVVWFENPDWTRHNIDLNLDGAGAVCAVDMNGDDTLDVVVGGGYTNQLVWYEAPGWDKHVIDTMVYSGVLTEYVENVFVLDIDNDGDLDILLSVAVEESASFGVIIFYEGPDWNKQIIDETLSYTMDMAFADLDGDDTLEVIATGWDTDLVAWYDLPGGERHSIASLNIASGVAVGDINMDGHMDIVATGQEMTNPLKILYGPGWSVQNLLSFSTSENVLDVAVNDINGDGDLDIVAAIGSMDRVVLFRNQIFVDPVGALAQVVWTKDPRNPVMTGGAEGEWNNCLYGPMVLENQDSARYEAWFTAQQIASEYPNRIGFATSSDGINWMMADSAVLEPDPGTWDAATVEFPMVLRENGQYKMWYTGWSAGPPLGIGYATSLDGIHWIKDTDHNPVMDIGAESWEAGGASYPIIIADPQGGYKMWYSGFDANGDFPAIGYAVSEDGINWQRPLNHQVISRGSTGEWDDRIIFTGGFIYHDGIYYQWYTGGRSWDNPPWHIGLAISQDGQTWTKFNDPASSRHPYADSDPVLSPSANHWDGNFLEANTVMLIADTLHLWYNGWAHPSPPNISAIGHATIPFYLVSGWANTVISSIEKISNSIIMEYSLDQNYPNPFNPITNIKYQIQNFEQVDLSIYNTLGQKVATLANKKQPAGRYNVQWDASDLASGIYLYRLRAGDFVKTKKLVILK